MFPTVDVNQSPEKGDFFKGGCVIKKRADGTFFISCFIGLTNACLFKQFVCLDLFFFGLDMC